MIRAVAFVAAMILASPVLAQQATTGTGGQLRVLDKITGTVEDYDFTNGQTRQIGLLAVTMSECRYPSGNPSGDAYVLLNVFYNQEPDPVFRGWMIASAPGLNPMDHQRYDVWALRCTTS